MGLAKNQEFQWRREIFLELTERQAIVFLLTSGGLGQIIP
jgi:hypothetical protein